MWKALPYIISAILLCIASAAPAQVWNTYTADSCDIPSDTVNTVHVDHTDLVWCGTQNGLARFDHTVWTLYTIDDGLACLEVRDIVPETTTYGPEIWIPTANGVSVASISPDAVTFATPYRTDNTSPSESAPADSQLIGNDVTAAAVDSHHVRWFGTTAGVSTFKGSDWYSYQMGDMWPKPAFLHSHQITSIGVAQDSLILFGTLGTGVNRAWSKVDAVTAASKYDTDWSGLASDTVFVVFIDNDGYQWFGTDKGVSKHTEVETKDGWKSFSVADGLPSDSVYAVAQGEDGMLWFGTANGAASLYEGAWETYLEGVMVNDIAIDAGNAVWFASNSGLHRYGYDMSGVCEDPELLPFVITIDGIYPNPFNPATTIEFTMPKQGAVSVTVYNMAGQQVRTIFDGARSAGRHEIVWNGTDDSGRGVSSGIYFARISMNGINATQRMTLMR